MVDFQFVMLVFAGVAPFSNRKGLVPLVPLLNVYVSRHA